MSDNKEIWRRLGRYSWELAKEAVENEAKTGKDAVSYIDDYMRTEEFFGKYGGYSNYEYETLFYWTVENIEKMKKSKGSENKEGSR